MKGRPNLAIAGLGASMMVAAVMMASAGTTSAPVLMVNDLPKSVELSELDIETMKKAQAKRERKLKLKKL